MIVTGQRWGDTSHCRWHANVKIDECNSCRWHASVKIDECNSSCWASSYGGGWWWHAASEGCFTSTSWWCATTNQGVSISPRRIAYINTRRPGECGGGQELMCGNCWSWTTQDNPNKCIFQLASVIENRHNRNVPYSCWDGRTSVSSIPVGITKMRQRRMLYISTIDQWLSCFRRLYLWLMIFYAVLFMDMQPRLRLDCSLWMQPGMSACSSMTLIAHPPAMWWKPENASRGGFWHKNVTKSAQVQCWALYPLLQSWDCATSSSHPNSKHV